MGKKAVGFYWTLPVPWAGFRNLPKDIEEAAKASTTIRYQMKLIRAKAEEMGFTLIREEAFLEIAPDRGTQDVLSSLAKLEHWCRSNDAALLYVDFSEAQGWRSHGPLREWSERTRIETAAIAPEHIPMDGKLFDPSRHFRDWRERQHAWSDGKEKRIATAHARAEVLRDQKLSYTTIADSLNEEKLASATGRLWTGEMVRKLLSGPGS